MSYPTPKAVETLAAQGFGRILDAKNISYHISYPHKYRKDVKKVEKLFHFL